MNPSFIGDPYASKRKIWDFLSGQKVRLSPLNFFPFNKSSLKMMKNSFYFRLKALFGLEIFTFFCPDFWLCRKTASEESND